METFTWKLEHELAGVGAGWTDLAGDVLTEYGLSGEDGILSTSPVALLASPGSLEYTLDNSLSNSGGKYGYYTPNHADCRAGFAKGIRVRYSELYGGVRYFQNVYWLKEITPAAGMFTEPVTTCKATDWLDLAMSTPMPSLGVQAGQTADQLLTTLLEPLAVQPAAVDFETGDSTFETAFDRDDVTTDSVYSALARITRSEFSRIYLQSDTATGGVLCFENRNFRPGNVTSLGTISNTMDGVDIVDDAGEKNDLTKVSITPRYVGPSNVVLASLNYYLLLGPGEERPIELSYRDPNGGNRLSGKSIVTPAAGDGYVKFGSTADGTASDLNASLAITVTTAGGNNWKGTVKNNGAGSGYVNLFQIRGLPVYTYDDYTVTAGTPGLRVLNFDMPYQSNILVADSVCFYLQSITGDNTRRGAVVKIHANKSAALMLASMTGGISSRWTLAETQTALGGDWFVNGRRWKISLGNRKDMEWYVVPASADALWILGTSALDVNTRLGV